MLYNTKNPHGGEVYSHPVLLDFSANINPLGTPEGVERAVMASLPLLFQYPDPYCRELVGAIARHEGVREDTVLCGNGAAELIFALCSALKPKKALLPVPSFSEYRSALSAGECRVEYYPLGQEDDFALTEAFLPVLEAFDGQLLMLCNPNNPTGQVIPPELLGKIADLCREKHIFLFVDECFLDLTQGGDGLSLKGMLGEFPDLLLLKAFTKSYGMAGLRLGYCLCADGGLLAKMARLTPPWNVSAPAQVAGEAALTEGDFLEKTRWLIVRERRWLTRELEALGLWVCPSQANFLLLQGPPGLSAALRQRGIAIRDCGNYHGLEEGWYRIAVRLPEENQRLITAIRQFCKEKQLWQ